MSKVLTHRGLRGVKFPYSFHTKKKEGKWFERYETWVYIDQTSHGVMEIYHAGINDRHDLRWAMEHLLSVLAGIWTPYLNEDTDQNKDSKLLMTK